MSETESGFVRQYGNGKWRKVKAIATVRLEDGTVVEGELHWYEAHGIGRQGIKFKGRSSAAESKSFAVCVKSDGYEASLELHKLYEVLPDEFGAAHGMVRVIDESGENYLFSAKYFVRVDLPKSTESTLRRISRKASAA